MRKYFHIAILSLICLCTSCKKDNLFDFNLQYIEADGSWGIPLLNDNITMEKLLIRLDSAGNIQSGQDGIIRILYETEANDIFNFSDFAPAIASSVDTIGTIPDIYSPVAGTAQVNLTNFVSFSVASDKYKLKTGYLESGSLDISFQVQGTYSITVTSDQLITPEGHYFSAVINNSQPTIHLNMSGYTIRPNDDQQVSFNGVLTINHPGGLLTGLSYHSHIDMADFKFNNIIVLISPYTKDFSKTIHLDFLNMDNFLIEDTYFNDPRITLHTQNAFCNAVGTITDAETIESSGIPYPFLTSPCQINVPYSPSSFTPSQLQNLSRIRVTSYTDSIRLGGTFTLNPAGYAAGEIMIANTATLKCKANTEIPLALSLGNAVYYDVQDNSLYNIVSPQTAESIDELSLRLCFTNTLPLDLYPEVGFIDTVNNVITPLDLEQAAIHGSYNGNPVVHAPIYVTVDKTTSAKIVNAQKFYLRFHFNTQGNDVVIKNTQYVDTKIGAKLKYSDIVLQ